MDVDMDIDLDPIEGGELQVNKPIRSDLLYFVSCLTFMCVDRHLMREVLREV